MSANRGQPMVDAKVVGDAGNRRIILELPFDENGPTSTSGKNNLFASTRGNQHVTVDVGGTSMSISIGCNVYGHR